MATTIVTKNGTGAPTDSDLVAGELAVDLTNGRLYTTDLDSGGTVLELGTNPASDVTFGDNTKAIFGAGSDLQIFHDASDSYIKDEGTGNLYLTTNGSTMNLQAGSDNMVKIYKDAQVEIFHDASVKLATTATGIDVTGTVTADGLTISAPSGDTPASIVTTTAGSFLSIADGNTTSGRSPLVGAITDDIVFYTSAGSYNERMRIDSGGSVLIGKSTPTDLHNTWNHLIIGEKGAIISENGAGGIDGITLADNVYIDADTGSYAYQTTAAASQITQSGGVIAFSNAASGSAGAALTPVERMRLDASGNLIVGNTVVPSASEAGAAFDPNTNGRAILKLGTSSTANQGLAEFFNPNGQVGGITTNGSATAYNTSSDQRLKENIVDAPSASDDIDAIQVRSFDWKADGSHQKYGMVAQELQTVAPEAVSVPEDPEEMMGVDYSKLVPMMLKEIQSLRARVAQLES